MSNSFIWLHLLRWKILLECHGILGFEALELGHLLHLADVLELYFLGVDLLVLKLLLLVVELLLRSFTLENLFVELLVFPDLHLEGGHADLVH